MMITQVQKELSTLDKIGEYLSYLKNLPDLILTSISALASQKIFLLLNFGLQSLFFSLSIINFLSSLLIIMGLTSASNLLNHKIVYYFVGGMFMWLHIFQLSDEYQYIHETASYLTGFYVCAYVVEGCTYVKQKIDGKHEPAKLLTRINSDFVRENTQIIKRMQESRIINQLFLIFITLSSTCFFIFIWYNIKVSKSLKYLENNYTILAALILSTFLLYITCIMKKVSLFLPAIVCLLIYSTLFIRIMQDLVVYEKSPELKQFNLPFESVFLVLFSVEGKEKHIRQSIGALKKELSDNYDTQQLQEKLKAQRCLINSVYWAAVSYYLYSITHGCTVHMEYMLTPVFLWYLFKNYIR